MPSYEFSCFSLWFVSRTIFHFPIVSHLTLQKVTYFANELCLQRKYAQKTIKFTGFNYKTSRVAHVFDFPSIQSYFFPKLNIFREHPNMLQWSLQKIQRVATGDVFFNWNSIRFPAISEFDSFFRNSTKNHSFEAVAPIAPYTTSLLQAKKRFL